MKSERWNIYNERFLREVNQFMAMDQKTLIKYIEKDLMRNNTNSDILAAFSRALALDIKNLFQKESNQSSSSSLMSEHSIPLLENSSAKYYIEDVRQALYRDGRLCAQLNELLSSTVIEQMDYISSAILDQESLGRNRYKSSSLPVAALIIKIGIKAFCDCKDSS